MIAWLDENWHLAGAVCAVLLLALAPAWLTTDPGALALVAIQLPTYQAHQVEEHVGDRFRRDINAWIGGGREVLTRRAVTVTNVIGVWALIVVAVWLAAFVDLSLGLIAIYLPIVNGVVHVLAAIARRAYNPGLVTSVVLFGGLGIPSLVIVSRVSAAGVPVHLLGLAVAIGIHALLLLHVRRRLVAPSVSLDARGSGPG